MDKLSKTIFFLSLTISILVLVDCASILRRRPLTTDRTSISEIRHRVEQNYLRLNTLKGRARISVESPRMNFVAGSKIRLKLPDSLFVNLNAGLGFGLGSLFIDRQQFLFYNSFENIVIQGNPDSVNFNQFLQIDVNTRDVIQIFSGICLIKSHETESLAVDKNRYLIVGTQKSYQMKYWIDPDKFVVTECQLVDSTGNQLIKFEYSNFVKRNKVKLPNTIRIFQPDQKSRLTLVFTNFSINSDLKKEDFQVQIPENVERVPL